MKKILASIVSFCLVLSFSGCINVEDEAYHETEQATEMEDRAEDSTFLSVYKSKEMKQSSDVGVMYYIADFEKVYISEEDGEKYPLLKNALDEFNLENKNSFENGVKSLAETTEELLSMGTTLFPLEDRGSFSVQRADNRVLSLLRYGYWYGGGAHGIYAHSAVNFDVETGKILSVNDVFTTPDDICPIIVGKVREKYSEIEFYDLEEKVEDFYNDDALSFVVGYQGVTFCFSPYSLGSYADGEQFVTIYYEEYPHLFNDKYTHVPESFVIGEPVSFDSDGDLKDDDFYIHPTYDAAIYIRVNGKEYKDYDYHFDEACCYFVRNDGEDYVYAQLTQEDWKISQLYCVNQSGIERVQTIDATGLGEEYVMGEYCQKIPCDVKNILLKTRENSVGMENGNKNYFIDNQRKKLITND